ncbi:putative secondary metabolism biosynthetic enzyme [Diaporthe eres]|uniref:Secondary metabolism biosynthetic enzyme n=1 Tax=Diaporthe eres TaxID=83184 RepID=A0ABR1P210_DIAER
MHPCTLDSMLQVCIPAVVFGDDSKRETWVPTFIKKGWLSSSGFTATEADDKIFVHASTQNRGTRVAESDLKVVSQNGELLGHAQGIEMTLVSDNPTSPGDVSQSQSQIRRLCWDMEYKPDPTLLTAQEMEQYALEHLKPDTGMTDFLRALNLYVLASVSRAVREVAASDVPPEATHLHKQYAWIMELMEAARSNGDHSDGYIEDEQYRILTERILDIGGRLGDIYVHFASHLVEMLCGDMDALQVLVPDNRLGDYYRLSNDLGQYFGPMQRYVDALAHKNPGLRILEVGAGTGGTTRFMLDALATETPNGTYTRFSRYDFTDVSGSFLESAEDEFGGIPKMNFQVFDVQEDPVAQGYEEHSYDLIVAANVQEIRRENQRINSRDSDGKIIMTEITATTTYPLTQFLFGFLPGWWLSTEPWRQNGPCASIAQWTTELKESGFTGPELVLNDFEIEDNHVTSLMISSVVPRPHASEPSNGVASDKRPLSDKTVFVVNGWGQGALASPSESQLTKLVMSKLTEAGLEDVRLSSFLETDALAARELNDNLLVIVQDGDWLSSLAHLSPEQYGMFNATLSRAGSVLWICQPASPSAGETQELPNGLVTGMARALRSEKQDMVFATVMLDATSCSHSSGTSGASETQAFIVEKSVQNFLQGTISRVNYERELVQIGDRLCIPRMYEDGKLNQHVHDATSASVRREQRFGQVDLKVKIRRPGLLDTIYFKEIPGSAAYSLGPDEIEVDVKAIGVNFRDCLIALGRVDQDILGTECAGIVRRVGSACQQLQPGDRVTVGDVDTYQGVVRCREILAVKIPDSMSFADAGAIPTNFVTAYHSFVRVAKLSPGETVLIHSGAGGTGQAAIQIAQHCGAGAIYTTVGSESKRQLLTERYGIPPEHIFNSRDLSFEDGVRRLTGGRGVDVVLNSLAGDALVASWECVAPFGRFVEIGKKDIFSHKTLPMFQFARNVSFAAVDLASMAQERPDLVQSGLRGVLDLFQRGILHMPSPVKSFPISDVEGAFRFLQSGTNAGKVVLEVDSEEVVPAVVETRSGWKFSPNETFILAGGLGAQGRVISEWMVSKGARNLVLLSRRDINNPSNSELAAFVRGLQDSGATVYCPKCDVSDAEALSAVLAYCKANLPPIKGCIQAAMELRDSVFENIDHPAWTACLRPKVDGSWNLHQQLPHDLDFFILFSSIAGVVGSQGQSNYAAGNTFQDELARHRLRRGEKTVSLNLSMIADHGYALDHEEAARRFAKSRFVLEMTQPEVLALLERYCDKRLPLTELMAAPQIAVGLELPDDIAARGMDLMGWMNEPIFSVLHQMGGSAAEGGGEASSRKGKGPALIKLIEGAASPAEAADVVAAGIATKLCRVLSLPPDAFDMAQPLHVYGVDSLIAVEMRNWLMQTLKADVAVFEILGGATAETLGRTVAEKVRAAL